MDRPDTPFLALDLGAFERNVERLRDAIVRRGGKRWRPHVKSLKAPAAVRALIDAGACGATCAKVSEAEVMVAAGIRDVLIAHQIVDASRARRLARLNREACAIAAADSAEPLGLLDACAAEAGVAVPLVVELDIGLRRAGVTPGAAAVALARDIARRPHLRFAGLMAWEGHATRAGAAGAKEAAIEAAVGALVDTARACERAGLPARIVSCGGTGTFEVASRIDGVTEIQAGGGVLGDLRYEREFGVDLERALAVHATVTSRPTPRRIVCDAGWKAIGREPTRPEARGLVGVRELVLSAEHGTIELAADAAQPRLGAELAFDVGCADATVFLHDELVAMRAGVVEAIWPLAARGKIQ